MTDTTRDEALWAQYAAAALPALIRDAEDGDVVEDVTASARDFADAMLAETRKRFPSAPTEAPPAPSAPDLSDANRAALALEVLTNEVRWFPDTLPSRRAEAARLLATIADGLGLPRGVIEVTEKDRKAVAFAFGVLATQGYEDMAETLRSLADRLERAISR